MNDFLYPIIPWSIIPRKIKSVGNVLFCVNFRSEIDYHKLLKSTKFSQCILN